VGSSIERFFSITAQAATLTNNDFSNGLNGWSVNGDGDSDVIVNSLDEAVLGDNNAITSELYQGALLVKGNTYVLDFYFSNKLSSFVPSDPSAFFDTYFASLYFIDDINLFNPFDPLDPCISRGQPVIPLPVILYFNKSIGYRFNT